MDCSAIIFIIIVFSFVGRVINNSKKKNIHPNRPLVSKGKPQNVQKNAGKSANKSTHNNSQQNLRYNKRPNYETQNRYNSSQSYVNQETKEQHVEVPDVDWKTDESKDKFQVSEMDFQANLDYNFVSAEDLLKDIEFPEVLFAGMNYINVPDTLPSFEMPSIINIDNFDSGTRSEANE